MRPDLIDYLCDPHDGTPLTLVDPHYDDRGEIESALLRSQSGRQWPVRNGIPRFIEDSRLSESVDSFGDEWNTFNFDQFERNWLEHTIRNTFGSAQVFEGKVVVDAGAGSGMQSVWIDKAGASRVIALELSHAVDEVMQKNIARFGATHIDVVQCSIDAPPIRSGMIDLVYCHNVIQHTPSVEDTAHALWPLVRYGGEFVFNCYPKNDLGLIRSVRLVLQNRLRSFLSRRSFRFIHNYPESCPCSGSCRFWAGCWRNPR